jgi:NADH dehydrogenase/NADH:ubiquinone oxidoreductase subunit G
MLENRITFVKEFITQSDKAAIYIGVNNLRNVNAAFLQQLVLQISKYFFSKNSKNDRLGYIHSSVGSLGFSHISMSNLVAKQDNPNYYYVGINVDSNKNHFSDNVTVFSTHYQKTSKNSKHYAIPSFYESTGHIISIENNVRKYNKVVTPAQPKLYSLETLINYGLAKSLFNYYI